MALETLANICSLLGISLEVLILALIWTAIWKGVALWKAARNRQLVWFIVLLVVNTVGILEILYIFLFSELGKSKAVANQKKSKKRK